MLNKRHILILPAIIVLRIPQLFAQDSYQLQNLWRIIMHSSRPNECLYYFHDTTGKSNTYFKSVTETKYYSGDSLLKNKKLQSRKISKFNKHGQTTLSVTYDTTGKIVDSAVYFYNEQYHLLGMKSYSFSEDLNKLIADGETTETYDNKGNCVRIASWSKRTNYYRGGIAGKTGNENDSNNIITTYTYDENGKPIQCIIADDKEDTLMLLFTYYPDGKTATMKGIMREAKKDGHPGLMRYSIGFLSDDAYFYKFDESGNMLQIATMDGKDTLSNIYNTYDEASRMTSTVEYNKGRLKKRKTIVYGSDKEKMELTDAFGNTEARNNIMAQFEDGRIITDTSCNIDTKTVDVYNNFGDLDSSQVTIISNGKPSVKTTAHKYVYNFFGKITSDSETVVEQSEYHASGTLSVHYYKYDNWGNKLEETRMGGEGITSDIRYTFTYNKQNYLLTEEDYGSCLDTPYATYQLRYYPDGMTEKELETTRGSNSYIFRFGEDTRKLEDLSTTTYGIEQTIYEYQNW